MAFKKQLPNILFIISDQHRPDWLGSNPKIPVRTPVLDQLSKSGVHFTQALCPSPVCGPSRSCLATGKDYDQCPVQNHDVNLPPETPTFYRALRDQGYATIGVGKFDLAKADHAWGLDGLRHLEGWGFTGGCECGGRRDITGPGAEQASDPYIQHLREKGLLELFFLHMNGRAPYTNTHPIPIPEEDYQDNWITRKACHELEALPPHRPWFLSVNFTAPHEPLEITPEMKSWYAGDCFPLPSNPGDPKLEPSDRGKIDQESLPPEIHQEIRRNYSAMVENIDRNIGILLGKIRQRGDLNNTWIIYTSDHGEMLGDRGLWTKQHPFQPSVGIPLIISGPGINRPGRSESCPANLIDTGATCLELAGANPLPQSNAVSLMPILQRSSKLPRTFTRSGLDAWRCGAGHWRLVFDGKFKLIQYRQDPRGTILFDLGNDPEELREVSGRYPEERHRLEALLDYPA